MKVNEEFLQADMGDNPLRFFQKVVFFRMKGPENPLFTRGLKKTGTFLKGGVVILKTKKTKTEDLEKQKNIQKRT